jgi:hypothetical protein
MQKPRKSQEAKNPALNETFIFIVVYILFIFTVVIPTELKNIYFFFFILIKVSFRKNYWLLGFWMAFLLFLKIELF